MKEQQQELVCWLASEETWRSCGVSGQGEHLPVPRHKGSPAQVTQTSSPGTQEWGSHGAEGHCHRVEFLSLRHSTLSTQKMRGPVAWLGLFSSQPCSPQPSCLQMMDKERSFSELLHTAPQVSL